MGIEQENLELRRMLAFSCCGALLYTDDGELQDSTKHPFIDFLRDSPSEIRKKMTARNLDLIREDEWISSQLLRFHR